ncbi:MAG: RDD family protein [Planctomycetes bacterium]|nr:RDD family protein [Planctomycetota bacterium]
MDEAQAPHPLKTNPLLLRLMLWPLILAVLFWETTLEPARVSDVEFQLTGNRTNLYAVLVAQSSDDDAPGATFFRRLDAMRKWSAQFDRPQDEDLLQTVAWQEDLITLYASGGMFFVGPSKFGYQSPPSHGWRPVAAAVDERTLMVVGLNAEGKPVFNRLSQKDQWGTEEAVDMVVDWTTETARVARAAVRDGQFHVVWTEPVPVGPLGGRPGDRQLRFAWRDQAGKWKGPFTAEFKDRNQTRYVLAGPVSVASLGADLGMLCTVRPAAVASPAAGSDGAKAEPKPDVDDQSEIKPTTEAETSDADASADNGQLVYARFYPSDGQWHVEWEAKLSFERPQDIEAYGLARFRDRLVAAAYDGNEVRTVAVAAAETSVQDETFPTVSIALPLLNEGRGTWVQTVLMIVAMVLVTVLAIRGYRQRVMPPPGIPDEEYRRRAARAAAYQVEKLMYLPVLLRRSAAFVIDMIIVFFIVGVILFVAAAWYRPDLFLGGKLADAQAWLSSISYSVPMVTLKAVPFVYFTATELILGRTPGKMICGLTIVDPADQRPAWWRIVDRNLMRPIELLWIPIGLLVILWTPRSQRIGDLFGGTRVVMKTQRTDRPAQTDHRIL